MADNVNYGSLFTRDNIDHLSGSKDILSGIAVYHDTTAYVLISATSLETAGAANTAVAIVDLTKWADNILYINSTNGPATNAGTTGLTVTMETRPASAIAWFAFKTNSAVQTTGLSAFKIEGSGVAELSGVTHFGDIRVTIENTTDSSGTATLTAWLLQRTPK